MSETQTVRSVLEDGFERIHEGVPAVVDGLSVEGLLWRPDADANHIAWLVWHLTRIQDDHVAAARAYRIIGSQAKWTKAALGALDAPPQGDRMPPSTELKRDISVHVNHHRRVDRGVLHGLGR